MTVRFLMGIFFCEKKSSTLMLGVVLDLNHITDGNFGVFPCRSGGDYVRVRVETSVDFLLFQNSIFYHKQNI